MTEILSFLCEKKNFNAAPHSVNEETKKRHNRSYCLSGYGIPDSHIIADRSKIIIKNRLLKV